MIIDHKAGVVFKSFFRLLSFAHLLVVISEQRIIFSILKSIFSITEGIFVGHCNAHQ